MKKIILTGGGTAGHVTPNLALIPSLRELGYEIRYIGSYEGIEKKLIENAQKPLYPSISTVSELARFSMVCRKALYALLPVGIGIWRIPFFVLGLLM